MLALTPSIVGLCGLEGWRVTVPFTRFLHVKAGFCLRIEDWCSSEKGICARKKSTFGACKISQK